MAVTKTSLINKALTLCGASTITSITDDTVNARSVNNVYEISLKSALTECKWNFATTRSTLTITVNTVAWYHQNESYTYTKPTDCLRVFETKDSSTIWREEGDLIITDTSPLDIKYVYYHDDPTKYPSYFLDAFIDKLCSDISYTIINSASKAESFLAKYEKISLPKAMSENSQIGIQQVPVDDEWTSSKLGNYGGNQARSYS